MSVQKKPDPIDLVQGVATTQLVAWLADALQVSSAGWLPA